jgi:type IV pilus assembly protein PilC
MKIYKYIVRNSSGERREGVREAASSSDILSWLREHGFTPISVNEITTGAKGRQRTSRRKRVKSSDLSAICWQLTTMLEGGVPVTTALGTVTEDIENLQLQQIMKEVLKKVEKGEPFSSGISKYPKVFNKLTVAIILAGETSGNLHDALRRLAVYFESRDKLGKKVKGAVAYPAFVLVFIILMVVFIMTFIIPRFKLIFEQLSGAGTQLPAFTRGFMGVYDAIRYNVVYIIGTVGFLVISTVLVYTKTQKGHYLFSKMFLAFPLIGKIVSNAFVATFCRTMSALLASGVSVLEVFDILITMTNNDIIKSAVVRTKENIVEGSNISLSMIAAGFFPNMVVKMTQIGEESGSLPIMLDRTADYYERKVDATVTTLLNLLEPIMIVAVGSIVLVVVLALYLPIFSMGK